MVPMVYFSLVVFVIGILYSIFKIVRAPKQPYTLKLFPDKNQPALGLLSDNFLMPTIRKDKALFWVFLILYHLAFLLLILGHLDLIPGIHIMNPDSGHMLGYGAVGVVLTVSVCYFLLRRFKSPVREISSMGDYLVLILLLFLFLTGGIMSWSNSWGENGFVLEKSDFRNYMNILTRFNFENPHPVLDSSHYFHVVFHVLLANIFLIIFPFTKFVHTFFALILNKLRRG
jgi:nitrate reductase gamma subunit